MVYRRCIETGCSGVRCDHPWYIKLSVNGVVEKGRVHKYAGLLEPGQNIPETKAEAELLEAAVKTWVARGRPPIAVPTITPDGSPTTPTDTAPKTLREAAEAYSTHHIANMKDKSAQSCVNRIEEVCGAYAPSALFDVSALRLLISTLREDDAKGSTINRHLARWSHFMQWCRAEYGITGKSPFWHREHNPTGIKREPEGERTRRLKKTAKGHEEDLLLKAAAKLDDGGMMTGRIYCAIDAGLRRGEMLSLKKEHILVDHDGHKGYTLFVSWTTCKTSKSRHVPVTSKRLADFITARRKKFAEFPFGQADGTRIDSFRIDWEKVLEGSGLAKGHYAKRGDGDEYGKWILDVDPDLHWHDLRHECGSRLAGNGVPLFEIKNLLGHADLETTQKYLNAQFTSLAKNMKQAHRKLGH